MKLGYSRLPKDRETGLIAGSLGSWPGDFSWVGPQGRVTVRFLCMKQQTPACWDRMVLPVSHTGLLYSGKVARHAANFLETGRFNPSE